LLEFLPQDAPPLPKHRKRASKTVRFGSPFSLDATRVASVHAFFPSIREVETFADLSANASAYFLRA
jgi:hypothetical protein